nr:hypothetical protein [Mycoplasmopsis bovis]
MVLVWDASKLISLKKKLEEEKKYKKDCYLKNNKSCIWESLEIILGEITELNNKKNKLNVNEKFKDDYRVP